MTLITKFFQQNKVLLAADNRLSFPSGAPLRSLGKKIVLIPNHILAIGVAGFYSFGIPESRSERKISSYISKFANNSFKDTAAFIDALKHEMQIVKCYDFHKTTSVFIFGTTNVNIKDILKERDNLPIIAPSKFNFKTNDLLIITLIEDLSKIYNMNYKTTFSSFDQNELNKIVVFNTSYAGIEVSGLSFDAFSALIYCIFHVYSVNKFGNNYYRTISYMNTDDSINFIEGFYNLINEITNDRRFDSYKLLLNTIGSCNQIAFATDNEVGFYKDDL